MKVQNNLALVSAAALAVSALTSGCGGLGEGTLPVRAVIQPQGAAEGATSTKAYTCLNTGLTYIVDFSNGSRGDFTQRATYSSSNPAVALASNLDVPVPGQANTFYSRGTIVAVAPGTATITARYLTFTNTIDVTVSEIQNVRVVPATANLAARSRLDLSAVADLDGVETAIDPAVSWSFVAPNTAVATIDSISGTMTGVAAGTGLTARASFPGCSLTADAAVTVANLQSLAVTRQLTADDQLVVGSTDRLVATGTLDNGETQDLSTQSSYASSDPTAISLFTSGLPNLALALKASTPVQITGSFNTAATGATPTLVSAPAISITPIADSLNTIAVSPATQAVIAGRTAQFSAIGSYASGRSQDITRHVAWSSGDTTSATIQSSGTTVINSLAGLATTSSLAGGRSVTITATVNNAAGAATTSTGTLNIQ